MDIIQALLLGGIQGLIEWLPISSSGQTMLIITNFLSLTVEEAYSYSLALHLGSFVALIIRLRKEITSVLSNLLRLRIGIEEKFLITATLVTGCVGMPIYLFFTEGRDLDASYVNMLIGVSLIITGLIMEKAHKIHVKETKELSLLHAVVAGIAQGTSAIPGISRSGITVSSLLLMKIEQERALKLSFILAIPIIGGASLFSLTKIPFTTNLLASFFSSFLVSLLSISALLGFARWLSFSKFCLLIGFLTLTLSFILSL